MWPIIFVLLDSSTEWGMRKMRTKRKREKDRPNFSFKVIDVCSLKIFQTNHSCFFLANGKNIFPFNPIAKFQPHNFFFSVWFYFNMQINNRLISSFFLVMGVYLCCLVEHRIKRISKQIGHCKFSNENEWLRHSEILFFFWMRKKPPCCVLNELKYFPFN